MQLPEAGSGWPESRIFSGPVPRVLPKERDIQEDKACEETGQHHEVWLEAAILRGVEGDSCETEYPNHSANDSDKR